MLKACVSFYWTPGIKVLKSRFALFHSFPVHPFDWLKPTQVNQLQELKQIQNDKSQDDQHLLFQ